MSAGRITARGRDRARVKATRTSGLSRDPRSHTAVASQLARRGNEPRSHLQLRRRAISAHMLARSSESVAQ